MKVRICQLDGSLPNLALMKLADWHRQQGHEIWFFRGGDSVERKAFEPAGYDRVYASAIFKFSAPLIEAFCQQWPDAILGGTGTGEITTVEQIIGEHRGVDYSFWPRFDASIGFSQRGCRLSCKFCVVPAKEGKPRSESTIAEIWRGPRHPKNIHLLDNDFFGSPTWQDRIEEIRAGGYKVCFSQGINVRAMTDEVAAALASIEYRDDSFKRRRLYTAWDNLKDEEIFFRGVDRLEQAGVPPTHLMAYMLTGFDKKETWERLMHRFRRMVARGIRPYPMVFGDKRKTVPLGGYNGQIADRTLGEFQRWVVTGLYRAVSFEEYDAGAKKGDRNDRQLALL